MSIDDILWALTDCDTRSKEVRISYKTAEAIAACLRAGQDLALEAEVAERAFCRLHLDAHGTEAVPVQFAGVSKSRRVWDRVVGLRNDE